MVSKEKPLCVLQSRAIEGLGATRTEAGACATRGNAMITLKNVLVATDFSECSQAAVEQAGAVAAAFDASLHVLHVVTEPLHEIWSGYVPAADFLRAVERLQAEARSRLGLTVSPEEIASGRVVVATAWGDPGDEILKYARTHDVDLIVCGTHGRRAWDHVVMGSVAERIVHLAPCPVLTTHAVKDKGSATAAA
jgi:nucleotide-binding universal stress UspA family protein